MVHGHPPTQTPVLGRATGTPLTRPPPPVLCDPPNSDGATKRCFCSPGEKRAAGAALRRR